MRQRAYVTTSLKQIKQKGWGVRVALVADGKVKLYQYIKLNAS